MFRSCLLPSHLHVHNLHNRYWRFLHWNIRDINQHVLLGLSAYGLALVPFFALATDDPAHPRIMQPEVLANFFHAVAATIIGHDYCFVSIAVTRSVMD